MFPRLIAALALMGLAAMALPTGRHEPLPEEVDSDETRRVLGSSVVTSVSVIMDLGHGGAALLSESSGQHADNAAGGSQQSETFANSPLSTQKRPVGSPPALMSPDRYEFYTFDESGELVRRLMTLEQIQSLIAGGDDAHRLAALTADLEANTPPSPSASDPQEEVVANVQQVLAEELLASIQKNGTEPQEGEVEVEAVVQEVPPPPSSSPRPEQMDSLEEDSQGSHEEPDTSSNGSDDTSGSTYSSGEDSDSQDSGVDNAPSSSQESNASEENGGYDAHGPSSDSVISQVANEASTEEYGDHHDSSIPESSTDAPVGHEDNDKPTTPSEYVSEKYGVYHISATTQSPTVMDEESTLTYGEEKTTLMTETETSVDEGDEITSSKYPETPSKNETEGVKDKDSAPVEPTEDDEGSKETMEVTTDDHSHTTAPSDVTPHAELTNKNPPFVLPEMHHEDPEDVSDPLPEVLTTFIKPRPDHSDASSVIEQDEHYGVTTQISEEPVIPADNSPPSDHLLDEIPNFSQTTDFQPPEEADLTAFYAENNQTSGDTSDNNEEDQMKLQGLLGLFSDKFSSLMGASDSLNGGGSQTTTTIEPENPPLQESAEEPNMSEIPEPSPSLLPPLVDDEDNSPTAQAGGIHSETTEGNNINDKDTQQSPEDDEEDSDLLDELAESVSGILSQVSDFVGSSEESSSKEPVHSTGPTTTYPVPEVTSVSDAEKNTTPSIMSTVEVLSPETSTHAAHTDQDDAESHGEGTTVTDGIHDLKPNYDDHPESSTPGSSSGSVTQESHVTYYHMSSTDGSPTISYEVTDGATDKPDDESSEHGTKLSETIEEPVRGNDSVESGSDYSTTTINSQEGAMTSTMVTDHFTGGSSQSLVEYFLGEKLSGEEAIQEVQEQSDSSTESSDADERFESSTSVMTSGGGIEATATTQRIGLVEENDDNDGAEKVTDSADKETSVKYTSAPMTTEKVISEADSDLTSEIHTDESSPIKETVTPEEAPEHSTVGSVQPVMKPAANKTDEEYLLEEMHKVAVEQSDPLLSAYSEDEQPEEQSSSLKDKHDKPASVVSNDEEGEGESEFIKGSTEQTMTTDHVDSSHTSTEVNAEGEDDQPSTTPTSIKDEVHSPLASSEEMEKEEVTAKPITSEDAEQSTSSAADNPSSYSPEDEQPAASTIITPTTTDSVKATTYRPVYIPLGTKEPDVLSEAHSSVSPDDLPDPNGLSPLLGEKKEPVPENKPTEESLPSSTEKATTASTPSASNSPGLASHVPPLMPAFPPAPTGNVGLEATSSSLDQDVKLFVDLCNDLAFSLYSQVTGASQSVPNIRGTHGSGVQTRSLVVSPFAISSMLAMVFLGARGPTSEQMNDLLHLDDVVTFNPHLVLQNVTESVITSPGVSAAAFVRELYSDKTKGNLLEFYKARAKAFYEGHVEEVDFKDVNDVIRRRTNHLVRWQTRGRVPEYLRGSSLRLRPPLAALSANFFEADCQRASSSGTDGEMYFEVPAMGRRRRRLVPIPAVVWRGVFLAGYDPGLDATVLELRHGGGEVSTVLVLPGRHGQSVPDDPTGGLARLETWLAKGGKVSWSSLLRSAVPRGPIEVQLPRFAHRSVLNVTGALTRMGLPDLFTGGKADLRGLDGSIGGNLHLSDAIQMTAFGVCAEDGNSRRHLETYPSAQRTGRAGGEEGEEEEEREEEAAPEETGQVEDETSTATAATTTVESETNTAITSSDRESRAAAWGEEEGLDEQSYAFAAAEAARELPLALRPRQARIPRPTSGAVLPRLRFDRPFLYFVRHNPSGFILLMGRFNPRLFP